MESCFYSKRLSLKEFAAAVKAYGYSVEMSFSGDYLIGMYPDRRSPYSSRIETYRVSFAECSRLYNSLNL